MRLYTVPNANAYTNRYPTVWRYPNLGSAAPEELNLYQDEDYKTPYTYSKYNIRHKGLTETQKAEMAKEYIYWADNWYVTPTIKYQLGHLGCRSSVI